MNRYANRLREGVTKSRGVDISPDTLMGAADELERLQRERDNLLDYIAGIANQAAAMAAAHGMKPWSTVNT